MTTDTLPNGPAPAGDLFHMGARGGKTGQAWQYVWDRLDSADFRDGTELAREAAAAVGIKDISVLAHLRLAVREQWLETDNRFVPVEVTRHGTTFRANRLRTFYRIGARAR